MKVNNSTIIVEQNVLWVVFLFLIVEFHRPWVNVILKILSNMKWLKTIKFQWARVFSYWLYFWQLIRSKLFTELKQKKQSNKYTIIAWFWEIYEDFLPWKIILPEGKWHFRIFAFEELSALRYNFLLNI